MPGGSTTQFLFAPEVKPNNRKFALALAGGFFLFCLFCTGLNVLLNIFVAGSASPLAFFGSPIVILTALIPNIVIALIIPRLQRYQQTHRYVLLGAFLGGAIVAIPPALLLEIVPSVVLGNSPLFYGTVPGIVEEGVKGAILLYIYFTQRDEFHDPVDGIVLGALIGLGFAMTEDITYFLNTLASGGVIGFAINVFMRVGLGWMNHAVWTAIMGAALGFARMGPPGPRRWLWPVGGYIVAAGLHNAFDLVATIGSALNIEGWGVLLFLLVLYGMNWVTLAVLAFVVIRGWHQQAVLTREELRPEVDTGAITAEEYAILPSPAQRRKQLRAARPGKAARAGLAKLFQLQLHLALQRRHSAFGDRAKVPHLHSEDALRQRIADLRAALAGGAPVLAITGEPGLAPPPASSPPAFTPAAPPGALPPPPAIPANMMSATPETPRWTAIEAPPPLVAPAPQPRWWLVVASGTQAGQGIPLTAGLTIGRSAGRATFVLSDPEVSGLHAQIEREGEQFIVADTGSSNGTFVNGARVIRHPLRPGDQIVLGSTHLSVEAAR